MVIFRELNITPDDKELTIDVVVEDLSIYSNVYLDSIVIDNQDTFIENGASSNPVYTYNIAENYPNSKHFKITLSSKDLDIANNLLFVYVNVSGAPDPSTPCGWDNITTLGVVCNFGKIYQHFMSYIREVEKECAIPKSFIDAILRFKALELSVNTGNYSVAVKYWNKFFKDRLNNISLPCGCNYGNI